MTRGLMCSKLAVRVRTSRLVLWLSESKLDDKSAMTAVGDFCFSKAQAASTV
eukprot:CAMPEP_0185780796 /NCGR_PEP_ID=MMETSP1174-20130828/100198_1 /TAXON_ID=35687 /ORGANISM="Dictyocha speculum, Strain CCMP1381" /LENGTH=51 /DNA_ID=CAMNT_0028470489 /DNA_START=47 /DNA_END=202 /DNA_ORIENTATION=-